MSTPLTDRIEALTAQANATTGASDTTLTDAVGTLIDRYNTELYSVGTDLVTKYIGRNLTTGVGLFTVGDYDMTTGEIIESTEYGISATYIPIDPNYTYYKDGRGRFYGACLYDADYNYIGASQTSNNLSFNKLPPFPQNARYMRMRTNSLKNNWSISIYRME